MIGPAQVRRFCRLARPRLRLTRTRPAAEQPLFVIGSGRSGNTLMRRVLLASGQIHIPPETYVLGDIIEHWPGTAALPWRSRVWLFCDFFERHPHFDTFGLENLDDFLSEALTLPDRSLKTLIAAFYRHLARAAGGTTGRWGDKTPWNTFHLDAIGQVFPQARYLWLIRDGRDVALSYRTAGLYPDLGAAAERWADANRACAAFARWAPHVRQVRYEALVANPEREFAAVFDWAGLSFDPAMIETRPERMGDVESLVHHAAVTGDVSTVSVGRWQGRVSEDEIAGFSRRFQAQSARLGYGLGIGERV